MSEFHFNQLDLNLLRVFDALLDERNVTRAGSRLGLSQSAVSHALGRLRQLLGDELFVRRSSGMDPTPRALEIGPALHTALLQMQAALAPAVFDPSATERRFSISAGPYGCAVLIPQVVRLLGQQAPGATLQVTPYGAGTVEALDTGRVDAALMGQDTPSRRFRFQTLFTETMVWVVRAGHPLTEGELTLERLLETPHILVSGFEDPFDAEAAPGGPGLKYRRGWDRQESQPSELARRTTPRKVAVLTPDSVSAFSIAARSDMAALVPRRLAEGKADRVVILPSLQPAFTLEIGVVFREDRLVDPAVAWLSRILAEAARGL
ncbi:MAG TPA: LysR family transcriptional regulator [Caulobacteraceae bacterium]|jgi:DNA-binding transcriptional LysR family regulator